MQQNSFLLDPQTKPGFSDPADDTGPKAEPGVENSSLQVLERRTLIQFFEFTDMLLPSEGLCHGVFFPLFRRSC